MTTNDAELREYYRRGFRDQAPATAANLIEVISATGYRSTTEADLQTGILAQLLKAGHTVHTEKRLNARDRIDFLVDGVGIEVKVAGSREALIRQLTRYAEHDEISELLVVTTRAAHHGVPELLGGKPVHLVQIGGIL